jgi:predicted Zn-dependent protease
MCLLVACQDTAERDAELLSQNKQDTAELKRLKNVVVTRLVTRTDLDSLKKLREKYPAAIEVRKTLQAALVVRRDWGALEKLLMEIPEERQTQDDKTELTKAYIRLGKGTEASQTIAPLADAKADDIELNGLAGQAFFLAGQTDVAAKYLDRIWEKLIAAKMVDEIAVRGLIYFYQSNNQKALEVLQQADKINANHIPTINALARVYAATGDERQAENYRAQAEKIMRDVTAEETRKAKLVERANELQKAWNEKRYEEVIRIAQEMIPEVDSANRIVLYEYIAQSYQALGKTAEAKAAMDEAAKLKK